MKHIVTMDANKGGLLRSGIFFSIIILFYIPLFSQNSSQNVKAIIDSVLNSEQLFLYGDATKISRELANKAALEMLDKEVKTWLEQQHKKITDDEIDNIIGQNTIMKSMKRADCWRFFMYIPKSAFALDDNNQDPVPVPLQSPVPTASAIISTTTDSVYVPKPNFVSSTKDTVFVSEVVIREQSRIDYFNDIIKCKTKNQLQDCLTRLNEDGISCEYYETGSIKDINSVYIVLYRRNGIIEAILSPGTETKRMNILTDTMDSVDNHPACVLCAFKFN